MRILHLIARYWPAFGGAESYLREVSERLAAEGHAVTVVTSDALEVEAFWDPARRRVAELQSEHNGVKIRRIPLRHFPLSTRSYAVWRYVVLPMLAALPLPLTYLNHLARYTPWVPTLWRWLEQVDEAYDLVAAAGILYEPFIAAGWQLARRRRLPFIVYPFTHLGAGPRPGHDPVSRYYTMRHQIALNRAADRLIAMTPAEGRFYQQHGLPAERVCVAGAGVRPEAVLGGNEARFRAKHGLYGPIVGYLSALTYDKGAVHLVQAIQRLWAEGYTAELVLAGAALAPFRRFLKSLPDEVQRRLRLLGSITEEEKRDLLASADVIAMPSRTDSFGIVYLEAWLYGKPVIGAHAWGIGDVIADGQDGLLVPFGDVDALADALRQLLNDSARRARMGACGRAKVLERFTWDHVYDRVRQAYSQVIQG